LWSRMCFSVVRNPERPCDPSSPSEAVSPCDKVAGADHLPPSSAQVNNRWSCTSTPPVRLRSEVRCMFVQQTFINFVLWYARVTGCSVNVDVMNR
jgi:hypothetical protein